MRTGGPESAGGRMRPPKFTGTGLATLSPNPVSRERYFSPFFLTPTVIQSLASWRQALLSKFASASSSSKDPSVVRSPPVLLVVVLLVPEKAASPGFPQVPLEGRDGIRYKI